MKNLRIIGLAATFSLLALSACVSDHNSAIDTKSKNDLVFTSEPEPVKGKLDVYNSMARTVKYNVDGASQNLSKKIYSQNPNQQPKDIIRNITNTGIGDNMPLYDSANVLEFAIIYATANLQEKPSSIEAGLYVKSSQHLALAAIRSHQDSWFALKKIKEIDRLSAAENKILKELNRRLERNGTLNTDDLEYKKNLEVALLKLSEIRQSLAYRLIEYSQLTKVEAKQIELEGRRFYELEDFDKKYNLEIFQEAAVRNRSEFALAKELVKSYTFNDVRGKSIRDYPDVERLDINGVSIANDLYGQELQQRAVAIADNLIEAVAAYKSSTDLHKDAARRRAFDELGSAILAQIEINYDMVKLADLDYQNATKELAKLQKSITTLEKAHRLTTEQKLSLLNQKIQRFELQQKQSQISAERAVALRNLYFNAGLSPFSKKILKAPIKDIVATLRTSFNQDLVSMLSAASVEVKKAPSRQINDWARSDNWLEELLNKPTASRQTSAATAAAYSQPARCTADDAAYKKLQLGSYTDKQNGLNDWSRLSARYTELKSYSPSFERSNVDGIWYYRLQISSPTGNLQDLCNQIRSGGDECLLR